MGKPKRKHPLVEAFDEFKEQLGDHARMHLDVFLKENGITLRQFCYDHSGKMLWKFKLVFREDQTVKELIGGLHRGMIGFIDHFIDVFIHPIVVKEILDKTIEGHEKAMGTAANDGRTDERE